MRRNEINRLVIIAFTANESDDHDEKCIQCGISDTSMNKTAFIMVYVVYKPIGFEKLVEKLTPYAQLIGMKEK